MYLTFLNNTKHKQLTWNDILANPYITAGTGEVLKKRVTTKITDDYAELLWARRCTMYNPDNIKTTITDIKTEEHYRHFQIPKKSNPIIINNPNIINNPDIIYIPTIENNLTNIIARTPPITPPPQ